MTRILRAGIQLIVLISLVHFAAAAVQAGEIKGTASVAGASSGANVAVWIGAIQGKQFTPPAKHAIINQHHMEFLPHVLVVLKGTTVEFLNDDATLHNVYWPWISGNRKLARNLGTRPMGQKLSFTFNNVGIVPLLCNVHTEMYGYIVVVPTPYFAVTGPSGTFDIKNVPAGHYTLKAWNEKVSFHKIHTQPVDVGAGVKTVTVNVK